jgi:hypothetical protein
VFELVAACEGAYRPRRPRIEGIFVQLKSTGARVMDRFARLHLVGRITYYVGWLALACGGIVHLDIAKVAFQNVGLSQRNLFEVSVVCFLICIASELRAFPKSDISDW